MEYSVRVFVMAAAGAVLTACGGGGEPPPNLDAPPAAPAAQPTGRAPVHTVPRIEASSPMGAGQAGSPDRSAGPELDPLVVSRLLTELDHIDQALRHLSDAASERREAIEVAKEARAELEKERPNKLKVRALLGGLAQAVQTLGGLKGAGKLLPQLVNMV